MDGVCLLVRDLDAELFFNGHDDLNSVQAVQAQVVLEMRRAADLVETVSNRLTCCVFTACTFDASVTCDIVSERSVQKILSVLV